MSPGPGDSSTLLGIDLGTSSVKAVVLDLDGEVLSTASSAYPVDHPRPGWAETDPSAWWSAVVLAVREAVTTAEATPAAIGLSGQMHGLVATGRDLAPVRPAMLWSDSRASAQLAAYTSLPEHVRSRLGNPLFPGMAGPLLVWLAAHEPEVYAATTWALQPKDWLRARLTGRVQAEPSDASATLLYDVLDDSWDVEVTTALGLDPGKLAPLLRSSGSLAGELVPDIARELGLHPGIPVAAGGADTAVAALGSGLVEPGTAQLTIGTGAQIVIPVQRPTAGRLGGNAPVTHLYRAATDEGWYSMAAVLNGGLALDWVRRTLGASWGELYAAAALECRSDDPLFLPHLSGERTPHLDPTLRGAWVGLAADHDRPQLLRAALEGVALAIRNAVDALRGPGRPVDDLRLAGGGTVDPAWRQLLADVLQARLRIVDVAAASGRGAALLGARAAGLLDEVALLRLLPPVAEPTVLPRAAESGLADHRRQAFDRTFAALRALAPSTPGPNPPM